MPRRAPEGSDGPTRANELVLLELTAVLWRKSQVLQAILVAINE